MGYLLRQHPHEYFVSGSPDECWEKVIERLNVEITIHKCLWKQGLPPLQHPTAINGLQMFGFFSPSIIHAIEARDRHHQCKAYWNNKLHIKNMFSTLAGDTLAAERKGILWKQGLVKGI